MRKLVFKHSKPEITTIKDAAGADIPISKALKIVLSMAIGKAHVGMEEFRKWVTIGDKLEGDKTDVMLEDAQFELVLRLFNAGVDQAFPTAESKGLASEVDRILKEATEVTPK